MARQEWTHIRVPVQLKARLDELALRLEWDRIQQQGNHENPTANTPPLWFVLQVLLDRDEDHRQRARTNSVNKRRSKGSRPQEGDKGRAS